MDGQKLDRFDNKLKKRSIVGLDGKYWTGGLIDD